MEKKVGDVDQKIGDDSGLVTTTALDTKIKEVDNKIPHLGVLVKKADYAIKMLEIGRKYFTFSDYNKFTSDILDAKINQTEFVNKSDVSNLVKNSDLNTKTCNISNLTRIKSRER